jgi:hypothetical protein
MCYLLPHEEPAKLCSQGADSQAAVQVSADHKYLAYTIDTSGNESYVVHVRGLAEGMTMRFHPLHDAAGDVAWALDNKTLFFTTLVRSIVVFTEGCCQFCGICLCRDVGIHRF